MKRLQIPQEVVYKKIYVYEKIYVHEKMFRARNCRHYLSKNYFLKNAKKNCKPNNCDLIAIEKNSRECIIWIITRPKTRTIIKLKLNLKKSYNICYFNNRTQEKLPYIQMYIYALGCLTLSWRRPLSYRNHSIDLLCKSMQWFLYDNAPLHERVKEENWGRICMSLVIKC